MPQSHGNAPSQDDKARIQAGQATAGHDTGKGTFPSRIQGAADRFPQGQGHAQQGGNNSGQKK